MPTEEHFRVHPVRQEKQRLHPHSVVKSLRDLLCPVACSVQRSTPIDGCIWQQTDGYQSEFAGDTRKRSFSGISLLPSQGECESARVLLPEIPQLANKSSSLSGIYLFWKHGFKTCIN